MIIGIDASHANKSQRTGVEEYCFQIIQELKKIIPSETKVVLYSNKSLISEFGDLPRNWEVKILNWPLKKMWSQFRLAFELWKNPPDVYFSPGQLLPFLAPKNSVVMVHDSAFEVYPNAYNFFGRQYLKWMNHLIIKKSNQQEMVRLYGQTFKNLADKIKVIPLAYDYQKYNLEKAVGPNIYGQYILSIGRLEEKKNTVLIINVFNQLKTNLKNLKLVLIGKPGAGYEKVRKVIDDSSFKNDIFELGYVDNVENILRNAQVFIFPSLYEGFGIPILEAMASGVPVVVSNAKALLEVGKDGVIFGDNVDVISDHIYKLITQNEFRKQQINAGLEVASSFSWSKTAFLSWLE